MFIVRTGNPLPTKRQNDVICAVVNTGNYPLIYIVHCYISQNLSQQQIWNRRVSFPSF